MKALDREILRLALPSILANLSVPLVGFADLAIAGHLHEGAAAASIAAVSVGALVFSVLYWPFAFLRASTGGLTAQAFGRGDSRETGVILGRGLLLAVLCSLVLIVFQWPFGRQATARPSVSSHMPPNSCARARRLSAALARRRSRAARTACSTAPYFSHHASKAAASADVADEGMPADAGGESREGRALGRRLETRGGRSFSGFMPTSYQKRRSESTGNEITVRTN